MRKILATAIVALIPSAAMAEEGNQYDGFGSIATGYGVFDQGDYSYSSGYTDGGSSQGVGTSSTTLGGLDIEARGSVTAPLGGAFALQVDGVFSRNSLKQRDCGGCSRFNVSESTGTVHVFMRDSKKGLIGVAVQRTSINQSYGSGRATYYAGGEAQLFLGRTTIGTQVAYVSTDTGNSYGQNGFQAKGYVRVYPMDNLSLALNVGYGKQTLNPGPNSGYSCPGYCYQQQFKSTDFGVKAEYRLPSSRISMFASFDYNQQDYGSEYHSGTYFSINNSEASNVRALFGFKLSFGSSTLRQRDRSGASLDPFPAPAFGSFNFEN
jgi:hypothetical protein